MSAFSNGLKTALQYALGPGGNALETELENAVTAIPVADIPLTSGHTLVGSAGGAAADVAISGDATLANTGVLSIAATKLAAATNAYIKTDSGVKDLLPAAAATRQVVIVVHVTTVFANGDGGQPTVTIGEESGAADKFMLIGRLTSAAADSGWVSCGTLTSGKKLQATLVAGTGTTETGAYTITAIAVG